MEFAAGLDVQNKRPEKIAKYIAQFMEPLLADPSDVKTDIHYKSILRLCEDAYNVALVLRKSHFDYKCESLSDGTLIDEAVEGEIKPQGFDRPQATQDPMIQGSRIAFTMFGALVKYEPAIGERYMVEKAHVMICRN